MGRYTTWLEPIRSHASVIATPFYWVTSLPERMGLWFDDKLSSRQELIDENSRLRNKVRVQEARLQKMAALISENLQLRELMNSSELVEDRVLVAELIGISPDPQEHKVIINKGSRHGVYDGQPVLDAYGLMGQVIAVNADSAEVLFITDNTHAIPVQVNRNSVRTVVEGVGDLYQLRLRYVPSSMDLVEGDVLISSGLGGRFPAGYPVAQVETIEYDPGRSFVTVYARPAAQLNRSRHVLLVFHDWQSSVGQDIVGAVE